MKREYLFYLVSLLAINCLFVSKLGSMPIQQKAIQSSKVGEEDAILYNSTEPNIFLFKWESKFENWILTNTLYAQQYNWDVKVGSSFIVSEQENLMQTAPKYIFLPDGRFIIYWDNYGGTDSPDVCAQLFDSQRIAIGEPFQVNTTSLNEQHSRGGVALSDGRFIICWDSNLQDGSGDGTFFQIFSSDGEKMGGEIQANEYTESDQFGSCIAKFSNDEFLISWTSDGQDGDGYGVFAQRFSNEGQKIGPEFHGNTSQGDIDGEQILSNILVFPDDSYMIIWLRCQTFGGPGYDIFMQQFSPADLKITAKAISSVIAEGNVLLAKCKSKAFYLCYKRLILNDSQLPYKLMKRGNDGSRKGFSIELPESIKHVYELDTYQDEGVMVLASLENGESDFPNLTTYFYTEGDLPVERDQEFDINYVILSAYPNPFNPLTTISYEIPTNGFVSVNIYDITGRILKTLLNENRIAGKYNVLWDGTDLDGKSVSTGVYFCCLKHTNFDGDIHQNTIKISLLK